MPSRPSQPSAAELDRLVDDILEREKSAAASSRIKIHIYGTALTDGLMDVVANANGVTKAEAYRRAILAYLDAHLEAVQPLLAAYVQRLTGQRNKSLKVVRALAESAGEETGPEPPLIARLRAALVGESVEPASIAAILERLLGRRAQ